MAKSYTASYSECPLKYKGSSIQRNRYRMLFPPKFLKDILIMINKGN